MRDKKTKEEEAAATASGLLERGSDTLSEGVKNAEELYGEVVAQVSALVRKHPMEALAVGFGVGCLAGLLLSRR